MEKGEKAKKLFESGYNCSQAVVLAFQEELGLDEGVLKCISSGFGGGMGRLREVCGAVSGAVMVIGALRGSEDPKDHGAKKQLYETVQKQALQFKEENGSYICRELLAGVPVDSSATPEQRSESYYKKRPCGELVRLSAEICEKILQERESQHH